MGNPKGVRRYFGGIYTSLPKIRLTDTGRKRLRPAVFRKSQFFLGGPAMIARAMLSGVSGMGGGSLYFTGRPRLRLPVPRFLSTCLTAYDCIPCSCTLATNAA